MYANRRNSRVQQELGRRETRWWRHILDRKWKYGCFAHTHWQICNITIIYGRNCRNSHVLQEVPVLNSQGIKTITVMIIIIWVHVSDRPQQTTLRWNGSRTEDTLAAGPFRRPCISKSDVNDAAPRSIASQSATSSMAVRRRADVSTRSALSSRPAVLGSMAGRLMTVCLMTESS